MPRKPTQDAPAPQALQEKDPNAGSEKSPENNDSSKKRGSKKASAPAASNKKNDNHPTSQAFTSTAKRTKKRPIFDTCDDVRKKLNEAFKHTTQAHLSREFTELLPTSSVSSRQLAAFLKLKGPQAGAHNIAFYAAYIYFEKIRTKENKKKTKKREKMEDIWNRRPEVKFQTWHSPGSSLGGFPRQGSHNAHMILLGGEKWRLDQYGEVQSYGGHRMPGISRKRPSKNPW